MPVHNAFDPSMPLFAEFGQDPDGQAWLRSLPALVADLEKRWGVRTGTPYRGGVAAWVAPAVRDDGSPAVLKISWPHREARGEVPGLTAWHGDGAVFVYEADDDCCALLVERCVPGTMLTEASLPAEERLAIAAGVLRRLWSHPVPRDPGLELVSAVTAEWAQVVRERMRRWRPALDPRLVALGADLLESLPATAARTVVIHGDFNPGNLLAAQRRPWLAIDPKSMIGDPGYDPCPLLFQVDPPFEYDQPAVVLRQRFALFADLAGEPAERLLAWSVARTVEAALWHVSRNEPADASSVMREAAVLADIADL